METTHYRQFGIMLAISFVIMYIVMYFNADQFSHVYLSLNRFYMTTLMVAPMALVMLGFMSAMYHNKKINGIIIASSLALLIGVFLLLRHQTLIDDKQYLRSMIPHHSSAILVSEEAQLDDPEVQALAKQIIESQKKEIEQMKAILARMKKE
ncbi:MAG: DUF305 domain-containing protein [Saprospiraceae bacterium]